MIIDLHAKLLEKMALGHFFDRHATYCGRHSPTHVPTSDTRVLEKGTAYQTDLSMCGDYNSVIGMDKNNSIMKFFKKKKKDSKPHFPSSGEATISGVIVNADEETGLGKNIKCDLWRGFK